MLSILWSKKTRALLAFLREGNSFLNKEYPKAKYYSKEQISWMLVSLFPQYKCYSEYALYVFMEPEQFKALNIALGGIYDLDGIQTDIQHVLKEIKDKSALAKYSSISSVSGMRL
ncbi:hypothetical protein [Thalassotalea ponticola]|uniref:hypothetical protein n=1 Tax=Thalassotalea ponticola TaxID=1523392 RepID=UPI0035289200